WLRQGLDVRTQILGNDLGAAGMQQLRDGLADATGGAGNQGDLAFDFLGNAVLDISHAYCLRCASGRAFAGPALVSDVGLTVAQPSAHGFRGLARTVGFLREDEGCSVPHPSPLRQRRGNWFSDRPTADDSVAPIRSLWREGWGEGKDFHPAQEPSQRAIPI